MSLTQRKRCIKTLQKIKTDNFVSKILVPNQNNTERNALISDKWRKLLKSHKDKVIEFVFNHDTNLMDHQRWYDHIAIPLYLLSLIESYSNKMHKTLIIKNVDAFIRTPSGKLYKRKRLKIGLFEFALHLYPNGLTQINDAFIGYFVELTKIPTDVQQIVVCIYLFCVQTDTKYKTTVIFSEKGDSEGWIWFLSTHDCALHDVLQFEVELEVLQIMYKPAIHKITEHYVHLQNNKKIVKYEWKNSMIQDIIHRMKQCTHNKQKLSFLSKHTAQDMLCFAIEYEYDTKDVSLHCKLLKLPSDLHGIRVLFQFSLGYPKYRDTFMLDYEHNECCLKLIEDDAEWLLCADHEYLELKLSVEIIEEMHITHEERKQNEREAENNENETRLFYMKCWHEMNDCLVKYYKYHHKELNDEFLTFVESKQWNSCLISQIVANGMDTNHCDWSLLLQFEANMDSFPISDCIQFQNATQKQKFIYYLFAYFHEHKKRPSFNKMVNAANEIKHKYSAHRTEFEEVIEKEYKLKEENEILTAKENANNEIRNEINEEKQMLAEELMIIEQKMKQLESIKKKLETQKKEVEIKQNNAENIQRDIVQKREQLMLEQNECKQTKKRIAKQQKQNIYNSYTRIQNQNHIKSKLKKELRIYLEHRKDTSSLSVIEAKQNIKENTEHTTDELQYNEYIPTDDVYVDKTNDEEVQIKNMLEPHAVLEEDVSTASGVEAKDVDKQMSEYGECTLYTNDSAIVIHTNTDQTASDETSETTKDLRVHKAIHQYEVIEDEIETKKNDNICVSADISCNECATDIAVNRISGELLPLLYHVPDVDLQYEEQGEISKVLEHIDDRHTNGYIPHEIEVQGEKTTYDLKKVENNESIHTDTSNITRCDNDVIAQETVDFISTDSEDIINQVELQRADTLENDEARAQHDILMPLNIDNSHKISAMDTNDGTEEEEVTITNIYGFVSSLRRLLSMINNNEPDINPDIMYKQNMDNELNLPPLNSMDDNIMNYNYNDEHTQYDKLLPHYCFAPDTFDTNCISSSDDDDDALLWMNEANIICIRTGTQWMHIWNKYQYQMIIAEIRRNLKQYNEHHFKQTQSNFNRKSNSISSTEHVNLANLEQELVHMLSNQQIEFYETLDTYHQCFICKSVLDDVTEAFWLLKHRRLIHSFVDTLERGEKAFKTRVWMSNVLRMWSQKIHTKSLLNDEAIETYIKTAGQYYHDKLEECKELFVDCDAIERNMQKNGNNWMELHKKVLHEPLIQMKENALKEQAESLNTMVQKCIEIRKDTHVSTLLSSLIAGKYDHDDALEEEFSVQNAIHVGSDEDNGFGVKTFCHCAPGKKYKRVKVELKQFGFKVYLYPNGNGSNKNKKGFVQFGITLNSIPLDVISVVIHFKLAEKKTNTQFQCTKVFKRSFKANMIWWYSYLLPLHKCHEHLSKPLQFQYYIQILQIHKEHKQENTMALMLDDAAINMVNVVTDHTKNELIFWNGSRTNLKAWNWNVEKNVISSITDNIGRKFTQFYNYHQNEQISGACVSLGTQPNKKQINISLHLFKLPPKVNKLKMSFWISSNLPKFHFPKKKMHTFSYKSTKCIVELNKKQSEKLLAAAKYHSGKFILNFHWDLHKAYLRDYMNNAYSFKSTVKQSDPDTKNNKTKVMTPKKGGKVMKRGSGNHKQRKRNHRKVKAKAKKKSVASQNNNRNKKEDQRQNEHQEKDTKAD